MAVPPWTWDEEKTDAFLLAVRNYKRQKLGEGVEWDSDKVVFLEQMQKSVGERWENDFGKAEPPEPDKPFADMTKEEYQKFSEDLRKEKATIALGYKRVQNKYKGKKLTLRLLGEQTM